MPAFVGLSKRRDEKGSAGSKSKFKGKEKPPSPMPDAAAAQLPGDEFALPTREVVRPNNQLQLTEQELGEEVAKMLTANNPAAPQNIARFNMKEHCYKLDPMVEQLVVHYASDGWLLHKASDEAKKQQEQERTEAEAAARFAADMERALREKEAGLDVELPDDSRRLRNRFNFSERAAQTVTFPLRDRATFTEPPPTATVSGSCSIWEIYDEYCRDFERQRQEEAAKQKPGSKKVQAAAAAAAGAAPGTSSSSSGGSSAAGAAAAGGKGGRQDAAGEWAAPVEVLQGLKILDRMVNQNTFADISMDFKYWEDTSDAFRPGEGSLLPLWQFRCERGKKHVTSICWSSLYSDMFAVGYGSYHFQKQGTGAISIFSLKNPSHAELTISTESGVMALHFHPEFANLLAVGCYNGSVLVFDVRAGCDAPLYQASTKAQRHSDPVWQVCWQPDELQKTLAFASISTDGSVMLWTLTKCELLPEKLMQLRAAAPAAPPAAAAAGGPDAAAAAAAGSSGAPPATADTGAGAASSSPAAAAAAGADAVAARHVVGGLCMDFSRAPGQEHIYLVGTEEGCVHRCSKAYGSDYQGNYSGHGLPVYAVKWNALHPGMFLSCSADWSVKVWDVKEQQSPLLSFDLGAAVGDAAWAPYSSSVFAAVTDDGQVAVFDLAQNRQLPLCVQRCTKKARLTRVVFNPRHPILLIGDSKGNVSALKLSPNLRKSIRPESIKPGVKAEDLERQKIEEVIQVARKSHVAAEAQTPAAAATASR